MGWSRQAASRGTVRLGGAHYALMWRLGVELGRSRSNVGGMREPPRTSRFRRLARHRQVYAQGWPSSAFVQGSIGRACRRRLIRRCYRPPHVEARRRPPKRPDHEPGQTSGDTPAHPPKGDGLGFTATTSPPEVPDSPIAPSPHLSLQISLPAIRAWTSNAVTEKNRIGRLRSKLFAGSRRDE